MRLTANDRRSRSLRHKIQPSSARSYGRRRQYSSKHCRHVPYNLRRPNKPEWYPIRKSSWGSEKNTSCVSHGKNQHY